MDDNREDIETLTHMVGALQHEVRFLWRIALKQKDAFSKEMMDSVRRGEIGAVRQFIRHGAEPTWRDDDGGTALHLAVFYKRQDIVNLLLSEGWPVDDRDNKRRTPLHLAAGSGRLEAHNTLIRWKARIDLPDENGLTPLHMAALGGHHEIVKELLAVNSNLVASEDAEGRTPLHLAARNGHSMVVKLLLKKGANPNSRTHSKHTPLHEAAQAADENSVSLLLDAGANPSVKDVFFRVPGDYVGAKPAANQQAEEKQCKVKEILRQAEVSTQNT